MSEKPIGKKLKFPNRYNGKVSDVRVLEEFRQLCVDSPFTFEYLAEEAFRIALPTLKDKVNRVREIFSETAEPKGNGKHGSSIQPSHHL